MKWIAENSGMLTVIVLIVASMIALLWLLGAVLAMRAREQYPFDAPGILHIGFNPVQLTALLTAPTVAAILKRLPRDTNRATDAVYYAMTRENFLQFHAALMKHVRMMLAEAAERQERFLRGDPMTLSELLIALAPMREHADPGSAERDADNCLRAAGLLAG